MAAPPPFSESLSMELLQEDGEWASLASASGLADEMDDADCQALVGTVEAMAAELARRISSRMLAAKSTLAQRAQMRQAQQNAIAAEEQQRLEAMLMDEATFRLYPDLRSRLLLIASAVFENFGYRQFVLYSRAKGLIQFVRGAKSWGDMKRRALGT